MCVPVLSGLEGAREEGTEPGGANAGRLSRLAKEKEKEKALKLFNAPRHVGSKAKVNSVTAQGAIKPEAYGRTSTPVPRQGGVIDRKLMTSPEN